MIRRADVAQVANAEFGPVEIASRDLELLQEAMGMSAQACLDRLSAYRPREMAEAWRRRDPRTPAEIREFYAESSLYVWELLVWNATDQYRSVYLEPLGELARRWPPSTHPSALDYGAGIGTAAIALAQAGYAVTIADIPGPTFEFAQARLRKRGIDHLVLEITTDEPRLGRRGWDVVSCLDVIEHVPDPATLTRALVGATRAGGGLAIKADFSSEGEDWPHHLAGPRARFAGPRWERFLHGAGLRRVAESVYRRGSPPAAAAARAYDALRSAAGRVRRGGLRRRS